MCSGIFKISLYVLFALSFFTATSARDKNSQDIKINYQPIASDVDSVTTVPIKWPQHIGLQQTGKINAVFNEAAQIGIGFSIFGGIRYFINENPISFETPSRSHHEYLFGGAIWVGAILDGDTLVSVSADGWNPFVEFGLDNLLEPKMNRIKYPSDYSIRSTTTDTVTTGFSTDPISGRPHTPLDIKITNRSHVWRNAPLDDAIYYDYLIDYIGPEEKLDSVYIGFLFDCDVFSRTGPNSSNGHTDDIAGSIKDKGIAYIMDNDGDPYNGSFNEDSPKKAFAFELLASSFTPTDTNFNWWISNGSSNLDFGPRLKGTPEDPYRDFGTGGLGTPEGDANKYYIMSHKEWDYDQVKIKTINDSDTVWLPPNTTYADVWVNGLDTRFLYSVGPITLKKGKPERIIFATFTADSLHTIPNNMNNLPNNPDLYITNLHLENLVAVGEDIKQALDVLLDPLSPPTGLQIHEHNKITFDPFVFDDVTDYSVYVTPFDLTTLPFPGVIPPWYIPSSPIYIGNTIEEIPLDAIDGLTAVNVAYISSMGTSALSGSAYINSVNNSMPIIKPIVTSTTLDSILIEWTLPESASTPAYYKLYKYANEIDFYTNYTKPYYLEGGGDKFTQDSILVDNTWWFYQTALDTPYAIIDGNKLNYTEYNFNDADTYFIISVDANGFESDYAVVTGHLVPERTVDFLLITNTRSPSLPTSSDTIIDFYTRMFDGTEMSYDIYSVADSVTHSECADISNSFCPNWQTMSKYEYIIIDESEFTTQNWTYEITNYLNNGGKLITFGILANYSKIQVNANLDWYPVKKWSSGFNNFGVDSIYYAGFLYNIPEPVEKEKFGFNVAKSTDDIFPSLECDTSRFPLDPYWITPLKQPSDEPVEVFCLKPSENSIITHTYKSLYPNTSLMENLPVGVYYNFDDGVYNYEVYTYGFHLYYMHQEHARDLLRTIMSSVPTDIDKFDLENLPDKFSLSQNYPNPFNPSTTIEFSIPKRSQVSITIYNLLGQQVKELTNDEYAAGNYRITWNGTNSTGNQVSSGIYLYRINSDNFVSTKKMVLLK